MLVFWEFLSKAAFGAVLLPLLYLIGFKQRDNSENVYRSLGVILYLVGHLFTMFILSVVGFLSSDGKLCDTSDVWVLYLGMLNPFTFNFFNSTLDYFVCHSSHVVLVQALYIALQFVLGFALILAVWYLAEKAFRDNFKPEVRADKFVTHSRSS
jgi:hypothetical protein